jgi:hypothetical protein
MFRHALSGSVILILISGIVPGHIRAQTQQQQDKDRQARERQSQNQKSAKRSSEESRRSEGDESDERGDERESSTKSESRPSHTNSYTRDRSAESPENNSTRRYAPGAPSEATTARANVYRPNDSQSQTSQSQTKTYTPQAPAPSSQGNTRTSPSLTFRPSSTSAPNAGATSQPVGTSPVASSSPQVTKGYQPGATVRSSSSSLSYPQMPGDSPNASAGCASDLNQGGHQGRVNEATDAIGCPSSPSQPPPPMAAGCAFPGDVPGAGVSCLGSASAIQTTADAVDSTPASDTNDDPVATGPDLPIQTDDCAAAVQYVSPGGQLEQDLSKAIATASAHQTGLTDLVNAKKQLMDDTWWATSSGPVVAAQIKVITDEIQDLGSALYPEEAKLKESQEKLIEMLSAVGEGLRAAINHHDSALVAIKAFTNAAALKVAEIESEKRGEKAAEQLKIGPAYSIYKALKDETEYVKTLNEASETKNIVQEQITRLDKQIQQAQRQVSIDQERQKAIAFLRFGVMQACYQKPVSITPPQ